MTLTVEMDVRPIRNRRTELYRWACANLFSPLMPCFNAGLESTAFPSEVVSFLRLSLKARCLDSGFFRRTHHGTRQKPACVRFTGV